jgi:hypothetical protein
MDKITERNPTLQWSEAEPPARILNGEALEQLLDKLHASADPEAPSAVVLNAFNCDVHILLGLTESFVYVDETDQFRFYITVGDQNAQGYIAFFLLGQHHTEFERRYLIPIAKARQVVREFYDTGRRSSNVQWEEGLF